MSSATSLTRLTSLSCGSRSPHKPSINWITEVSWILGILIGNQRLSRRRAMDRPDRWRGRYGPWKEQSSPVANMLAKWAACRESHEITVNTVTDNLPPPLFVPEHYSRNVPCRWKSPGRSGLKGDWHSVDGILDNEHERCNFDLFRPLKSILVTLLYGSAYAAVSQIRGTFYCTSIGNNYANNSHNAN